MNSIILILSVSVLTLTSQMLLKKGVTQIGEISPDGLSELLTLMLKLFRSPHVISGVILAAIAAFIWLIVISRVNLSYAFPISGGFFYISLALLSWLVLKEKLSVYQWLGTILISTGVILVGKG